MKYLPTIAGIVLGLLFIMAAVMVLFHLAPMPEMDPASRPAIFMSVFGPSGWMTLVKVLELIGGILVAIPLTRNIGLLILGPIIVNILAYNGLVGNPKDLANPMVIIIVLCALYLLWAERRAWAGLVNRTPKP
jgi:uncharacterized membrane protein YphA (DoxX/SURF4 family)